MSLAAARSPLASPALKHAACYFSMAGASHLGVVATSPGAARSPHAHLGSPHAHLGGPHFNTPATSPGHMHLALPAGFALRLPQRGADEGEGFTLRLPAEKRMAPRSPGLQHAMSPRAAAMSPRSAALGTMSAAAMSPRTLGTTSVAEGTGELSQLQAPAKDFTLTLPAPRRKARMQLDALEDAAPAAAVKMARKETSTPNGKTASGGGGGGFVELVRRTVRFVLPAPAAPKGASEFRSCRGRPPTPYPKKKKGGKGKTAEEEAPDYFSHQV